MVDKFKNHPEWEKENSLTAPEDRDSKNKWRPNQGAPKLTEEEVENALTELNNIAFVEKFPRVDRTYADPPPSMQHIGLLSFTPAKGAVPNDSGVFGFAKLRGNYPTKQEAEQRAEFLIRNVDSYHQIYHTYVGRPFPITISSDYSAETTEIDIRKQTTESISANIKTKKNEESKTIKEIKEREEALLEDVKKEDVDPYENYITLRVKKAQLSWTYLEHVDKIKEIRTILSKTREEINDLEAKNEEYKSNYYAKYMNARKNTGFKDTDKDIDTSFLKFLVEEAKLPGIDENFLLEKV